ncbi:MAG TPA: Crp/Fnr family transcriptional regulator [Niabella sp.]|nr:Crp/Fnr family transcriptional regulator [Chitinophagaceae bacterium]HRN48499.1 Crp/Fnr family transcriptional regulator [Niabella sp.]HRO85330.1 Crp/Fnr family transcriptional regulator [Niabella sp.]
MLNHLSKVNLTGQYSDPTCAACILSNYNLFSGLNENELEELSSHKSCSSAKKGQIIFSENGLPMGVYCIHKGKVKLSTTGPDGKEQILRLAKDGDLLGYRALLAGDRYHATATALEDCDFCFVERDYFVNLVVTNPKICIGIFKIIAADLKSAEDHIVSLSQKNVRERMAEALLFFKATYGFENDGQTLNIQFSREEIADFVGTSTESAIRLLSEFNHDKIVELKGKKIRITNLDKLVRTANLLY